MTDLDRTGGRHDPQVTGYSDRLASVEDREEQGVVDRVNGIDPVSVAFERAEGTIGQVGLAGVVPGIRLVQGGRVGCRLEGFQSAIPAIHRLSGWVWGRCPVRQGKTDRLTEFIDGVIHGFIARVEVARRPGRVADILASACRSGPVGSRPPRSSCRIILV